MNTWCCPDCKTEITVDIIATAIVDKNKIIEKLIYISEQTYWCKNCNDYKKEEELVHIIK